MAKWPLRRLADKATAPVFVGYWTDNGQNSALALIGWAANDPKRTPTLGINRGVPR